MSAGHTNTPKTSGSADYSQPSSSSSSLVSSRSAGPFVGMTPAERLLACAPELVAPKKPLATFKAQLSGPTTTPSPHAEQEVEPEFGIQVDELADLLGRAYTSQELGKRLADAERKVATYMSMLEQLAGHQGVTLPSLEEHAATDVGRAAVATVESKLMKAASNRKDLLGVRGQKR